jgi:hypothetical protein
VGNYGARDPGKTKLLNRVRRIRGQLEAIERALEGERGCAEVEAVERAQRSRAPCAERSAVPAPVAMPA